MSEDSTGTEGVRSGEPPHGEAKAGTNAMTPEQKVVFGLSPRDTGVDLLLGISLPAWEYMKDGNTHTIDLTKLGLPFRLIIWGGATQAEIRAAVETHNAKLGLVTEDQTDRDFSIEGPPPA